MTEISQPTTLGLSEPTTQSHHAGRDRAVFAAHMLLLAGAIALAVATSRPEQWDIESLAILVALSALSELTSSALPAGTVAVSGSFLGIMLAAVLLGGAPAALVAVITIGVGWLTTRESGEYLRQNLVTYAWFPLLSGLLFHALAPSPQDPTYYLLVFATFVFALVLNLAMVVAYQCVKNPQPLRTKLAHVQPVMSAELASAILTVLAAFMIVQINNRHAGLLIFAIVLVVFQYLIGELLLSQSRGDELRVRATTDDLTGLANRTHFNDRVDEQIEMVATFGGRFGLLLLDLDHFKDINDTLGHQYGDDLLKEIGPRLERLVGEGGLVARFGGDEFAILPALATDDEKTLTRFAERVLACLKEPVEFDEITLQVEGSIGVACYPVHGPDAQTLLRRADVAMYNAKAGRNGYCIYAPGQDHHSASRLSMVGEFRRALERDHEIVVHFHPIVNLGDGRVHGAEALVRWQHPSGVLLQPGAFLEIVEQTGLIGKMTERVLERSIAECAAWHASGRDLTVSVNLSVRNLHDPMLSAAVEGMLARHRLPADALKLEITESMILSDPELALRTIQALSDIGVRFAVDDFGTGHSSLKNLRQLPVHELKIDRSFVTPMLNDESDGVIVRSTVELGHALGLKVTAEGVEDALTLARLEEIGCDRAQGYHLSKPIPPIEFMGWVSRYESRYLSAA